MPSQKEARFQKLLREKPETFCMYPFSHVNFKFGGKAASCFRSRPLINLLESPPDDIWNSEGFLALRKNLSEGTRSESCENCWKLEEGGGFSYRQESLRNNDIHAEWRSSVDSFDPQTGRMLTGPAQVEIRLSNLCQMTCRMCAPEYSSKWQSLLDKNPALRSWRTDLPPETRKTEYWSAHEKLILDFVREHNSSLRYVMFTGGEPLLQKSHYAALACLSPFEHRVTLEYTTNLNTLRLDQDDVLDYWRQFEHIRLKISLDADPEIYPFVRVGGSLEKVEKNLRALQERFPTTNRLVPGHRIPDDFIEFFGTCTVSVYNIYRLPEIARYFTRLGLFFHTSQVQEPLYQSAQCLPPAAKRLVAAKLEGFLAQLAGEITPAFSDQPIWRNEKLRGFQLTRIRRFVENSLNYMNARDESARFAELQKYEEDFARASGTKRFADLYPELMEEVSGE